MNKLTLTLALALLIASQNGYASDEVVNANSASGTGMAITFDQALRQAYLNNPELRKSEINIEITNKEKIRARSAFYPRIDITSSSNRIETFGSIPGLESLLLSGQRSAYYSSSAFILTHNLFNGGADVAGLNLSGEKVLEASLQFQLQRATLSSVVLDQFHVLRQAELELQIAELNSRLKAEQLKLTESDFSLGRKAGLAVSEAEYELQNSDLIKFAKERTYKNAKRDLMVLIGADVAAAGNVVFSLEPRGYRTVLEQRGFGAAMVSEVDVSASRIRQANLDVKRVKSHFLPKIDINLKRDYAGVNAHGFGSSFRDQGRDKYYVGFSMTWNLFNGFDTWAELGAANARVAYEQVGSQAVSDERRKKLNELTRQLADAQEEAQFEQKKLDLAKKKLDIGKVKLELGKMDGGELRATEVALDLQRLELAKRSEAIDYYQAKLLIKQGSH